MGHLTFDKEGHRITILSFTRSSAPISSGTVTREQGILLEKVIRSNQIKYKYISDIHKYFGKIGHKLHAGEVDTYFNRLIDANTEISRIDNDSLKFRIPLLNLIENKLDAQEQKAKLLEDRVKELEGIIMIHNICDSDTEDLKLEYLRDLNNLND